MTTSSDFVIEDEPRPVPTFWLAALTSRLASDAVTVIALIVLLAIVVSAILASWISPYDPATGDVMIRLRPIGSPGHWLGTDETGRDILSRLLHGGRLSLLCGVAPVMVALVIGGGLGLVAGSAGGLVRTLIMRVMDVFYAFPSVLLAVALTGALGGGLLNTLVSLAVVFTPSLTRVTEATVSQVAGTDYVRAARATGASFTLVTLTQVLPNALAPVLVYACSLVSTGLLLGAGLSYLGFGVQPPDAEWGLMLNALRQSIYVDWTLAVLPGVAILATSLAINLASDGLRHALDVRLAAR